MSNQNTDFYLFHNTMDIFMVKKKKIELHHRSLRNFFAEFYLDLKITCHSPYKKKNIHKNQVNFRGIFRMIVWRICRGDGN